MPSNIPLHVVQQCEVLGDGNVGYLTGPACRSIARQSRTARAEVDDREGTRSLSRREACDTLGGRRIDRRLIRLKCRTVVASESILELVYDFGWEDGGFL